MTPDGPYEIRDGSATDTEALLEAAGYAPDAIAELVASGVVA